MKSKLKPSTAVFLQTDFVFFTPVNGIYEDEFKVCVYSKESDTKLKLIENIKSHTYQINKDKRYCRPCNNRYPRLEPSGCDYKRLYPEECKKSHQSLAFAISDRETLLSHKYLLNLVWHSNLGKTQIIWLPIVPDSNQEERIYKDFGQKTQGARLYLHCAHTNIWDESIYIVDNYKIEDAEEQFDVLAECENKEEGCIFSSPFGLGSQEDREYYLKLSAHYNSRDFDSSNFELCVFKPCRFAFREDDKETDYLVD